MGLAAAFLGKGGQPLGTLLQVSAEQASAAELKPVLLEMKTQVTSCCGIACVGQWGDIRRSRK